MARLSDDEDASSSSESDTGSDSSSVHTIFDHPPRRAHGVEETNGYSPEYFIRGGGSHFSGKLVDNRAKRKLRSNSDASDDDRAAKTVRLDSWGIPLTAKDLEALNHQDSDDSDYDSDMAEEGEDEEEDQGSDMDLGLVPSDRSGTLKTRPAVQQQPELPKLPKPVPAQSLLPATRDPHTSTDKTTVYDLMCLQFPKLHFEKEEIPETFRPLADVPALRKPKVTGPFNNNRIQNTVAYLIQASGHLLPDKDACEICRSSERVFRGCVVSKDPIVNEKLLGACACCWYGRRGYKCSFRQGYEESNTPDPVPQMPHPPKQTQLEPRAEQTTDSPSVLKFQQSLRPSSKIEVLLKSPPVSALRVEQRSTQVPVPQVQPKPASIPAPQVQPKPTPVPVPQVQPRPTPVPVPQVQPKPTSIPVPQVQQKPTPVPVPQIRQISRPASVAPAQETPKPAPVSKVQETWKPVTKSPVPIPVPPITRRSNSGENQRSTPIPAQSGNGSGNGHGTVRKETPVFPPNYTPIRPPMPPTLPKTDPPASINNTGDKNSDHFTGLSVALPPVSKLSKKDSKEKDSKEKDSKEVSLKDRVDRWKKRYERMPLQELQDHQERLAEWSSECNVQIQAMMSVLMKKCTDRQAKSDGA
ncbi:hypothetical protein V8F33_005875 [Rhypophila sp. PSN 637]